MIYIMYTMYTVYIYIYYVYNLYIYISCNHVYNIVLTSSTCLMLCVQYCSTLINALKPQLPLVHWLQVSQASKTSVWRGSRSQLRALDVAPTEAQAELLELLELVELEVELLPRRAPLLPQCRTRSPQRASLDFFVSEMRNTEVQSNTAMLARTHIAWAKNNFHLSFPLGLLTSVRNQHCALKAAHWTCERIYLYTNGTLRECWKHVVPVAIFMSRAQLQLCVS